MKEFLIISTCSKDSVFTEWIPSESNFDLVLLYNDDDTQSLEKFKNITEWIFPLKGEKWFLINQFISQNLEFISNYSYIWFPDSDISISTQKINELFEINKKYKLWISQPCFIDNCTYSITKKHPSSYFRFTNYVQDIAPIIKTDKIKQIIHTFESNRSTLWFEILGSPKQKFAIIDRIVAKCNRPENISSNTSIDPSKINFSYISDGLFEEFPNFLTSQECQELIGIAESKKYSLGRLISHTKDLRFDSHEFEHPDKSLGYRKAQIHWFDESNILVSSIKKRIADLSDVPVEYQEGFHFVKYTSGGEYRPHFDAVNRIKTALIYLNDAYEGGETYFTKAVKTIKPQTGKLIIWNNLLPDGKNRPGSFHCGLPVDFGTKYIGVIWIRSPLTTYTKFEDINKYSSGD
jgi:hypothetical protein